MGMTAMFSYLNRRAVPAEEMWDVVSALNFRGFVFLLTQQCNAVADTKLKRAELQVYELLRTPKPLLRALGAKVSGLGHFSVGRAAATKFRAWESQRWFLWSK